MDSSTGWKMAENGGNRLVMDQGGPRSVGDVVGGNSVLENGGKFLDSGGNYVMSAGMNGYGGYGAGMNGYSAGMNSYSAGMNGYSTGAASGGGAGGYANLNLQMAPNVMAPSVMMHGHSSNKLASVMDLDDGLSTPGNYHNIVTAGGGTLTAGGVHNHHNHSEVNEGNGRNGHDVKITKKRVSRAIDLERWTSDSPKLIEGESEEARAER